MAANNPVPVLGVQPLAARGLQPQVVIPGVQGGVGGAAVQQAQAVGPMRLTRLPNTNNCVFQREGAQVSDADAQLAAVIDQHCAPLAQRDSSKLVEFRGMYFQILDTDPVIGQIITALYGPGAEVNAWTATHVLPVNRAVQHALTQQDFPYHARVTANGIAYRVASCGQTCLSIIAAHHPTNWAVSANGIRRCAVMTIANQRSATDGLGAASNIFIADVGNNAWIPVAPRLAASVHLSPGMPEADARRTRRLNVVFL